MNITERTSGDVAVRLASNYIRYGSPGCTEQEHWKCVFNNFRDWFVNWEQFVREVQGFVTKRHKR